MAALEKFKNRFYIPRRLVIIAVAFFGMFNIFAIRMNSRVPMIPVFNNTKEEPGNGTINAMECEILVPSEGKEKDLDNYKAEQYALDFQTEKIILDFFSYGFVLTQIPGGYFSEMFGAKWVFGSSLLSASVLTLATPLAVRGGTVLLSVNRFLIGMASGSILPSLNTLVSRWSPKMERSRFSVITFAGGGVAMATIMYLSSWLTDSGIFEGRTSVFILCGSSGCTIFLSWTKFVFSSPEEHPSISQEELTYIEGTNDILAREKPKVPWIAILSSVRLWAVVVSSIGQDFGYFILMSEMPIYFNRILHFNIKSTGAASALPYMLQTGSSVIASCLADRLRESEDLSVTTVSKIFNTLGLAGPGVCLLGMTISHCHPAIAVSLFSLAVTLNGLVLCGFSITLVDMSPHFAGTLSGITYSISSLCGIVGPIIAGIITESRDTALKWNNIFYLTAAVYILTATFFAIFATADLQPWGVSTNYVEDHIVEKQCSKDSMVVRSDKTLCS